MFRKMMQHLANNPGLKILSLLIAVILWLIVVNYDNPEINRTFTIQVGVKNEETLENMGKVYEVVGQSNYATFYCSGKRKIVESLSPADFTATADLSQIINLSGSGAEKLVPIEITANRYASKLTLSQKNVNMKITIEDLSTEQFYISSETTGQPVEGYAIGEVTVSPNLIKISGPQSMVTQVSKVAASVSVDELTKDITANVVPILYDKNGRIVESSQLRLSQEKVTVNVQMLGTKTVPIRCETIGMPANGYRFMGLEYAPEKVSVKGEPYLLNNIHEIVIPGEAINLEGATGDVENSIDITPYLGKGISLVNAQENKIAVKASIEKLETKIFELPMELLEMQNVPEEYEVTFIDTKIKVPVRGLHDDVQQLTEEQIIVSADFADLEPGSHNVQVNITIDEKFQLMGEVLLRVRIKEIVEEDETDTEETMGEDVVDNNTQENTNDKDASKKPDNSADTEKVREYMQMEDAVRAINKGRNQ